MEKWVNNSSASGSIGLISPISLPLSSVIPFCNLCVCHPPLLAVLQIIIFLLSLFNIHFDKSLDTILSNSEPFYFPLAILSKPFLIKIYNYI
jgi:hypothetical protein